uniref:Uncharacterized protein LOC111110563 n=1 Tax=Crassostrea virginica TaxID=6565 RepID=A0A8B8BHH6_CRAVI|nr:uncharacterized protein LOC111110563 [Crassostrea virginica]
MATGIDPAVKMEIKSELVEYFPYDEETTDVVIRVDDKRMHLSRGTLMQASPVFRKMLGSNGKEKQAEITLPEKSYEEVILFLRCISPREFVKLDEESIGVVLPLAHEYQVKATLQKCEDWLLTEMEFIVGEVTGHTKEIQEKVEFFAKCLLYGTKHDLETLYKRALELLVPYKLSRYQHTEFYKLLPDKPKSQLLETRMVKIEKTNSIGDGHFSEEEEIGDEILEIGEDDYSSYEDTE